MKFKSILFMLAVACTAVGLQAAAPAETIHEAVRRGDVVALERFIEQDPTLVNQRYGFHCQTPLHFAALKGDENVVRLLLKHGAGVSIGDRGGTLPSFLARLMRHDGIADILNRWPAKLQMARNNAKLALFMGLLPRTGKNSPVRFITPAEVRSIFECFKPEHFAAQAMMVPDDSVTVPASAVGFLPQEAPAFILNQEQQSPALSEGEMPERQDVPADDEFML